MTTEIEPRVNILARPKPLPAGFQDDRRSVYTENNLKKDWDGEKVATTYSDSTNHGHLVQPKNLHSSYIGDRPSPIWKVSPASMNATASSRLDSLAEARKFHKNFQQEKSVYTIVSDAAKKVEPSQRIEQMSKPKQEKDLSIKPNSAWDWSEWESDIPIAALRAEPKERVIQLAKPKDLHSRYKGERPVQWQPSRSTLSATASSRLQELASAKKRLTDDYTKEITDDWTVSSAALKAEASDRTKELCVPIQRKIRQKRMAAAAN